MALDASSYAFQLYRSGVVDSSDNCGSSINHGVVIIGYSNVGDGVAPVPPVEPVDPVEP